MTGCSHDNVLIFNTFSVINCVFWHCIMFLYGWFAKTDLSETLTKPEVEAQCVQRKAQCV